MSTENFFENVPVVDSFLDVSDISRHVDVPRDWLIVVSDVVKSTEAIKRGQYKSVNTIGATVIISILNIDRDIAVPYMFGGDGATLAIPPSFQESARKALLTVKRLAKSSFDIDLRVGMVPVRELTNEGMIVRCAKYKEENLVSQTILSGRGWEAAEGWLKTKKGSFVIEDDGEVFEPADLSGLECRWEAIPSFKDHKLNILVVSMEKSPETRKQSYQNIYAEIDRIYGSAEEHHPIKQRLMSLSLNPMTLLVEARIRTRGFFQRLQYVFKAIAVNIIGRYLFKNKVDTDAVAWSRYQEDLIKNTDYRKFDGMFKMVLDGTEQQRDELVSFLEEHYQQGKIAYGYHQSREALITCIIFSYNQDHAHFVDGADGGYAIAAIGLKDRLEELRRKKAA